MEIAKGLTFVAVTGALFYLVTFLLLKSASQPRRTDCGRMSTP